MNDEIIKRELAPFEFFREVFARESIDSLPTTRYQAVSALCQFAAYCRARFFDWWRQLTLSRSGNDYPAAWARR